MNNNQKDKLDGIRKARDEGWLPFMMNAYAIQKGVPKDKIAEEVAKLEKEVNKMLEQEE